MTQPAKPLCEFGGASTLICAAQGYQVSLLLQAMPAWDEFEGHLLPITPDDRSSLSNAGECSHLLSQGTNMYSPQSNTVVRWQDAFRERMQKRFSEVESNVSSFADKIDRKNEYHKLELMKSRCHQRLTSYFPGWSIRSQNSRTYTTEIY